jgi:hypothetical protein
MTLIHVLDYLIEPARARAVTAFRLGRRAAERLTDREDG